MIDIYRTSNESTTLTLSRVEDGYLLKQEDWWRGEIISESNWRFPDGDLPDELLMLLCECDLNTPLTEQTKPLPYEYERLMWKLGTNEYSY